MSGGELAFAVAANFVNWTEKLDFRREVSNCFVSPPPHAGIVPFPPSALNVECRNR